VPGLRPASPKQTLHPREKLPERLSTSRDRNVPGPHPSRPILLPKPQRLPQHPIHRRRRTIAPAAVIRQVIPGARLWGSGLVNPLGLLQENRIVDLRPVEGRLDGWVVDELGQEGGAVVAEAHAAGFDFLLLGGRVS
jgi:hypothetical protein